MKKLVISLLILVSILAPSACGSASDTDDSPNDAPGELNIGDTWTVDGEWSLTITSVEETDERNKRIDYTPEAVYIVSYTYTNFGYSDPDGIMKGLYFNITNEVIDSAGNAGINYPVEDGYNPQVLVDKGDSYIAQACIGVNTPGDFKIIVTMKDSSENLQTATFNIKTN